jgi:S-adenosylmethionine decarboxylase
MGAASSATPAGGPVAGFFEGTEKRIEVDFRNASSTDASLRKLDSSHWSEVVALSKTTIIGSKETDKFGSWLLSESSLLVYPHKVILKTCGTTVPMNAIQKILACGGLAGLEPEWLCYSRKNFLQPWEQPEEHRNLDLEMERLRKACGNCGEGFILGPLTGEHWMLYNAEWQEVDATKRGDITVDMMMYGLPADVRNKFYTSEPEGSRKGSEDMTERSGLSAVVKSISGEIDDYCFSPCGYSCNVHADDAYAIVHVTPEEKCSYASFETNFGTSWNNIPQSSYAAKLNDLVKHVIEVFRPERFTMTLFVDSGANEAIGDAPFGGVPGADFKRVSRNSYHFESDYVVTVCNYKSTSVISTTNGKK